jgi:RHS repeat-associated protein
MSTGPASTDQTISLPHGGGALQGIGETFAPDLHTGTGNFTIPIAVPPGRNGFQPHLALTYSTGSGNGPFGLGWSLGVPSITRKTAKGVPRYRDGSSDLAQRDVFILSGSEDLVPITTPSAPLDPIRYRPQCEGLFARIDHHPSGDHWEVRTKDGLTSRYGAAQADGERAVVANPAKPDRIFAWRLSETVDPFGNRIVYEYWRDRSTGSARTWDQLYLSRILYADFVDGGTPRFLVTVRFEYAERPDPFSDCRAGFETRTRYRCTRIAIRTHADKERLVRTYDLLYLNEPPELPRNGASLLSRIVVTGHDDDRPDGPTEPLPPVEFRYTTFQPDKRKFLPLSGHDLPARSLAGAGIELVDLFGRGLPDFLEMNGTVRYWRNRGGGSFDRPREMASALAGLRLGDPGVQLVDADGNGRADLLVTNGLISGYYTLSFEGRWDERSFQRFPVAPSFDLRDPQCHLVDLDGDGVTDAIHAGARLECFFHRPDKGWNETQVVDRSALAGLQGVNFSDPRLRWADMNGDGLQDIVLIHNGRIDYWPYLGYGQWGQPISMANSPHFADAAIYGSNGYDPKRLLLGDVDGDGAADLVYVENGQVTLWINRAGNGWSDPIVIRGTPRVTDIDSVRLVDLLGNGIAGLLWSTDKISGRDNLRFLDFTGGIKPYLLSELNNNTGAVTRVAYQPSTYFYLADEHFPQARWRTPLPFPVQVVAHTEAIDAISGGRLTTDYSYHHGFWDGGEREFRGFGRVDHRDTEVFRDPDLPAGRGATIFTADGRAHSPPLETRTWFHQGAIGDADDWTYAGRAQEFWPGDPSLFGRAPEFDQVLNAVPEPERGRARRDALRALRGHILRTELYALDGTPLEGLPYTVAEHQYAVREVDAPGSGAADRRRIFFIFPVGERTTQWERGTEPMHHVAFTGDYDEFGQPRTRIDVAVPRGRDPKGDAAWPEPYLATQSVTAFAAPNEPPLIADRVAHATTYEIVGERTRSVLQLRDTLFAGAADVQRRVIGQTLSLYDGPAFAGLPLGSIGDKGALVRAETLVLTPEILAVAYPDGMPPCFVDGAADWSEYPDAFRSALPPLAGYLRRTATTGSPFVTGLYAITARRQYDFQRVNDTARGLVRTTKDALWHETNVSYDSPYALLPMQVEQVVDPDPNHRIVLQTNVAAYDYRVLQPREVVDPNGNHSLFAFTPLGLLESAAVMGKPGEPVGDTPQAPGIRHIYDFGAYAASQQPISVRTVHRVHHANDTSVALPERDAIIETVEYSDGLGRLLQTRGQAEDVLFGDAIFGGGVLPADPHDDAGTRRDVAPPPRIPTLKPNVVVSGAQTYDNKGRVVEKYEPYFATGWAYAPPGAGQYGQKATLYYDARGRVIRTVNPDGSELRVVHGIPGDPADPDKFRPTPWEAHSYGPNDNAGRTPAADPNAASYDHHWNTPSSAVVDALGRTVVTVERNRARRANPGDPLPAIEPLRTTATYDISGNPLAVTDALGRTVVRNAYDLANRALRRESLDAGIARSVIDAAGNALEARDVKGALALRAYDGLNRPVFVWARDGAGLPLTLCQRLLYGDAAGPADAAQKNMRGRLYRHYDEAGLLSLDRYDFKGNVLEKARRTVRDALLLATIASETPGGPPPAVQAASVPVPRKAAAPASMPPLGKTAPPAKPAGGIISKPPPPPFVVWHAAPFRIDWQPPAGTGLDAYAETLLDPSDQTSLQYDALNRVQQLTYPVDATGARRALHPIYNRAGRLESVWLDQDLYVARIAYNARGQRTLIVYGNAIMTRYAYDPHRFRLVRLRSERLAQPAASALVYHPSDADHPLQDLAYAYDLDGNILSLTDRTPGCGVLNNPDAAAWTKLDPPLAAQLAAGDALIRRFAYDPLGRLESATGRACITIPMPRPWDDTSYCGFGSGQHGTPNQDNAPSLTALYRESYAYDPAGNLLRLRHERGTATVRSFGMGGRTAAAWDAEWRQHVSGDPWPNAPGNQLTHLGDDNAAVPQTHVYDPAGNLLRQNVDRHFFWDAANRLRLYCVQVLDANATPGQTTGAEPSIAAHYLYSSAGQRVKKLVRTQGGAYETTVYIDGIFERRSWTAPGATPATATVHHVMDDQRRIALVRSGAQHPQDQGPGVQYRLGDHLDSSAIVIDNAGNWINREEFSPYGETTFGSFARKRYRFTGKERDAESGLCYHGARYYAPWLARWVSCDPAGVRQGLNLYRAFLNNPLKFVDQDGKADNLPSTNAVDDGSVSSGDRGADTRNMCVVPKVGRSFESRTYFKYPQNPDQKALFDQAGQLFSKPETKKINSSPGYKGARHASPETVRAEGTNRVSFSRSPEVAERYAMKADEGLEALVATHPDKVRQAGGTFFEHDELMQQVSDYSGERAAQGLKAENALVRNARKVYPALQEGQAISPTPLGTVWPANGWDFFKVNAGRSLTGGLLLLGGVADVYATTRSNNAAYITVTATSASLQLTGANLYFAGWLAGDAAVMSTGASLGLLALPLAPVVEAPMIQSFNERAFERCGDNDDCMRWTMVAITPLF